MVAAVSKIHTLPFVKPPMQTMMLSVAHNPSITSFLVLMKLNNAKQRVNRTDAFDAHGRYH